MGSKGLKVTRPDAPILLASARFCAVVGVSEKSQLLRELGNRPHHGIDFSERTRTCRYCRRAIDQLGEAKAIMRADGGEVPKNVAKFLNQIAFALRIGLSIAKGLFEFGDERASSPIAPNAGMCRLFDMDQSSAPFQTPSADTPRDSRSGHGGLIENCATALDEFNNIVAAPRRLLVECVVFENGHCRVTHKRTNRNSHFPCDSSLKTRQSEKVAYRLLDIILIAINCSHVELALWT